MFARCALLAVMVVLASSCGDDGGDFEELRRLTFDESYDVVVIGDGATSSDQPVVLVCPVVKGESANEQACASVVVADWQPDSSVNAALYRDGFTTLLTVAPPGSDVEVLRPAAMDQDRIVELVLGEAIVGEAAPLRLQVKIAASPVDVDVVTVCLTRPNGERSSLLIARDDSSVPDSEEDPAFDRGCVN